MQVLNRLTLNDHVQSDEPLFYLRKNGFYFNQQACELIGLHVGDLVELHVDGGFVFISKTVEKSGFQLRRIGENKGLTFSSKGLDAWCRKHWKKDEEHPLHFLLKESQREPRPFVKYELCLKTQKNG